jgi:hypothetical protein
MASFATDPIAQKKYDNAVRQASLVTTPKRGHRILRGYQACWKDENA